MRKSLNWKLLSSKNIFSPLNVCVCVIFFVWQRHSLNKWSLPSLFFNSLIDFNFSHNSFYIFRSLCFCPFHIFLIYQKNKSIHLLGTSFSFLFFWFLISYFSFSLITSNLNESSYSFFSFSFVCVGFIINNYTG